MPTKIEIESELPEFDLLSSNDERRSKKDIIGRDTVLFLYPKDDSSSCTREAKEFSDNLDKFMQLGANVIGVSKDTIKSHKKFIEKHSLQIELLSDETITFITAVGSWIEKSMYGKTYMGTERTTILVSKTGKILNIWRKVKVPGHVQEVLDFLREYNSM